MKQRSRCAFGHEDSSLEFPTDPGKKKPGACCDLHGGHFPATRPTYRSLVICPARTRGTSPSCLPRPTPQADKFRRLSVPWSPRVWPVLLFPTDCSTHSSPYSQGYTCCECSRLYSSSARLSNAQTLPVSRGPIEREGRNGSSAGETW